MSQIPHIPTDPLARFFGLYEALNAERGWWNDASALRFAAITAMTCAGEPAVVAAGIRRVAEEVKRQAGWAGALRSELRFIVGAILLLHDDEPSAFLAEVGRVRGLFREAGLRRAEIYESMAILVLRMQAQKQPVTDSTIRRFKAIYEEMKRHHWWLTGPDDFPACALLCGQDASPEQIGRDTEDIYQALHHEGLATGDPLQTAANILYLTRLEAGTIAQRFRALAEGFRARGVSIRQNAYDELAILSFLNLSQEQVTTRVLEHREAMKSLKPKPPGWLRFNLATSVAFLDLAPSDPEMKILTDVKALLDMQAILQAQQAAVASAAAASAAT